MTEAHPEPLVESPPETMTEESAKLWLAETLNVSRETFSALDAYVALILDEMTRQNLIAPSTAPHIWARHIVDSAQLLLHTDRDRNGLWLDLGSGAGLPGMVIALLTNRPVRMVESRRLRHEFLSRCVTELGLSGRVAVEAGKLEAMAPVTADVISARAFAPLPKLLTLAARFADESTRWVLPKGANAAIELDEARRHWVAHFQIKASVTSDDSGILVGTVKGKAGRAGRRL